MELSAVSIESLIPVIRLQLEVGGRSNLVVTGHSMYPTLRNCRDIVELVPVHRDLHKGDLILYQRRNGAYVLHRIVTEPVEDEFNCAGDNQWELELVQLRQVIALVDTYIRGGKRIPVDSRCCRTWVRLWIWMFPVRKPILKLRRSMARLRRRLRGRR